MCYERPQELPQRDYAREPGGIHSPLTAQNVCTNQLLINGRMTSSPMLHGY